ncbi:MAG: hypothetical protein JWO47_288 [Candidatus Saccharibacteria bacterium]|nr:hypothetical protein [Candidatus Saccharibacteria bacterium]
MSDQQEPSERRAVWLRVLLELPKNLAEEHLNNIRGRTMGGKALNNKKLIIGGGLVIVTVAVILLLVLPGRNQYSPTILSKVPHAATLPACLQTAEDKNLTVTPEDYTFIQNNVVLSIIDVPAGTNVDVLLKSFSSKNATGTAVYTGKYGRYNFTAQKTSSNSSDSYTGGWKITHFEACKV